MNEIPTIVGQNIILRKIRECDIDDRYSIGRHPEFVHMCEGESLPTVEYPKRESWVSWYNHNKEAEFSWIIELGRYCIVLAGFHHILVEDNSASFRIGNLILTTTQKVLELR